MIRNSFIFLPGIGPRTEKNIWSQDIKNWDDFINSKNIKSIGKQNKIKCDKILGVAKSRLYEQDSAFFVPLLQSTETWRLYEYFKDEICFLDIETVGYDGYVTVVGIYDGYETKTMVKNINLDKNILKKELEKYKLIVTFNGSSFDLPVLKRYFGNIIPNVPHIDLRHCCAKVGLKGGLKQIEEKMKIKRPDHLKVYGGDNAVDLWRAFMASGDREYLDLLVQYNEEDIVNLKPLMNHVYNELKAKTLNDS